MKAKIHPKYHSNAKVTCVCGNTFDTGSTLPEIKIDICSACHPFFTGEMKFVDTQGRVEKFQTKMKNAQKNYQSKKQRKAAKIQGDDKDTQPKTLKEMIQVQQKTVKTTAKSDAPNTEDKKTPKTSDSPKS
jgi:large subunit ribosomal protein L31